MLFSRRHPELPAPPVVPKDEEYLKAARRESTDALIEAVHRGEEVRRVSSELKGRRVRNGFPEMFSDALEGRR